METEEQSSGIISSTSKTTHSSSCSYSSNWTIIHGSFEKSLTFETSDSPIDDSDDADSNRKSPLVLKPSSPESGPCEIKLSFSQKHEIRQVYVRSTARIYEIYYARALQSSNEYLCSVRCSIVARGDELLRESDNEEAVPTHTKVSDGESSEKKSTSENSIGTNEDDWVEVNPDSPPLDNENISLPRDTTANRRSPQDFYEATAEISDADPCISLVLRLLSLENKGCIYVDEVYVYADPVESSNLENQAVQRLQVGNSAGSSLMAMFVPTLLHMTRSGVGQSQDKHNSTTLAERKQTDKGPRKTESTGYLNVIQRNEKIKLPDWQDVKLQEVSEVSAEASEFQIPAPVSDKKREYNSVASDDSHLGRVMEQLISRVRRIEDICLRFEANMLKPINSMEARLQRVEDQLEVFVKNTQYSGFPSCVRFSAPAFSSLDSSSSSFYNDGSANPRAQSEMEKQDAPIDDVSNSSEDISKSVRAPKFLPSLVVTAPEFSCGEEDEENVVVPPKDPPLEKPKQTLSIDDALAAALVGFSTMTISEPLKPSESASKSTNEENVDESFKYTESPTVTAPESTNEESANDKPSKYTQSLKVTAPDFSSEDNVYDDKVVSPKIENGNLVVLSDSFATNGDERTPDSVSASSNTSSATQVANSVQFKETSEGGDGLDKFCEEQSDGNFLGTTISFPSARSRDELTTDDCQAADESSNRASKVPILDRFKILRQLLNNQTKHSADTTKEASGASGRDVEKGSDKDLLVEVPKSSYASVLDFEAPILEVKFALRENSSSDLPLEALLTDTEIELETSLVQKSGDGVITTELNDLVSVQDEERKTMRTNNHLLVDLESYDAPVISEIAVGLQDPLTSIKQEIVASLI